MMSDGFERCERFDAANLRMTVGRLITTPDRFGLADLFAEIRSAVNSVRATRITLASSNSLLKQPLSRSLVQMVLAIAYSHCRCLNARARHTESERLYHSQNAHCGSPACTHSRAPRSAASTPRGLYKVL